MRIAIISDSHDNIPNIEKALYYINERKMNTLIHCGDIFTKDTVKYITNNFSGKCHFLISSDDAPFLLEIEDLKKNKNLKFYYDYGQIIIDKNKIGFTHFPKYLKTLAKENLNIIFYGHTHRPWVKQIPNNKHQIPNKSQISNSNGINPSNILGTGKSTMQQFNNVTILANPGTLAGMFYKATFAVLDTKTNKLELKILEKI